MKPTPLAFCSLPFVLGCVAPLHPPQPATSADQPTASDIERVQQAVERLEHRLFKLETEVSAASAEDELTRMTIESVQWPTVREPYGHTPGDRRALLCRVTEWRGFGKMKRFTRLADPAFNLESEGHMSISAWMSEGGVSNVSGSVRFVVLDLAGEPDRNVRYTLRPQNGNEKYRWDVAEGVTVTAR